jgi:hypothetical protein
MLLPKELLGWLLSVRENRSALVASEMHLECLGTSPPQDLGWRLAIQADQPCQWLAKRFCGLPASIVRTVRPALASCSAALNPAKLP